MTSLNRNNSYKLVPKPPPMPDKDTIPANWLQQLSTMCSEALNLSAADADILNKKFQEHAGPNATYLLKADLIDNLQNIYLRFSAKDSKALPPSQKVAIAAKLQEGALYCTGGLHDRAKGVVRGFYLPESLDALLAQIREGIINRTALENTNEVHTHNRFFTVAESLGCGVHAINPDDPYRGDLTDNTIAQKLATSFKKYYKVPLIFNSLVEGIKGVLHSQYEYVGKKIPRYTHGEYGKFIQYLEKIFGTEISDHSEYFILDDKGIEVVDLNWKKIKQTLFTLLLEKNHIDFSTAEKTAMERLVQGTEQEINIDGLFPGVINNTSELGSVLLFLDYSSVKTKMSLVHAYMKRLATIDERITALGELIKVVQANKELVAEIYQHSVKDIIQSWNSEANAQVGNTLAKAIYYHPEAAEFILKILARLPPDDQAKILTQVDTNGHDILLRAMAGQPKLVAPILTMISHFPPDHQLQILTQTTKGFNRLISAILLNSEAVKPILEMISRLPPKHRLQILTQVSDVGANPLMVAIANNSVAVAPIVEMVSQFTVGEKMQLFTSTCSGFFGIEENILALAVHKTYPKPVELVLKLLDQLPLVEQTKLLTLDGVNGKILMQAIHKNSELVPSILERISKLPLEDQVKILDHINNHQPDALEIAVRRSKDVLQPLVQMINSFPLQNQIHLFNNIKTAHMVQNYNKGDKVQFFETRMAIFLAQLNERAKGFKADGEDSLYETTLKLEKQLEVALHIYKQSAHTPDDTEKFKSDCEQYIATARPVLSKVRGLDDLLSRFLLVLAHLVAFVTIDSVTEKNFVKTKGEIVLDEILDTVRAGPK